MHMKLNIKTTNIKKALAMLFIVASIVSVPLPASAESIFNKNAACDPTKDSYCVEDKTATSGDLDCDGAIDPETGKTATDAGCNLVTKYVNPIIKILSGLAGVAVIIGIIYGGILYASSAGDAQQVAKSKLIIRNSVIALLAFFFLYAFLKFLVPGNIITG